MIDDFKGNFLGGGARANQYTVLITTPTGIDIGLDKTRTSYLVRGAARPASTLGEIPVPFRGRSIFLAGDRADPDTWDTTFLNDTDFMIRNAMERWSNGINNMTDNEGLTNPVDYQVDAFVDQLDRNGSTIKSYTLRGVFPTTIDAIPLDYNAKSELSETSVTLAFQYFESNTTT